MSIRLENIGKRFGKRQILKGISVEFAKGCFTGMIGKNGCGKSTLLRCICRTLRPDEGTVYLDGRRLDSYSCKESARKISVLAQYNMALNFSVLDVVLMGRTPYKKMMERDNEEDYAIAWRNLDLVGMREFAEARFSHLSGGEQQRVLLARALTQEPEYLILDEPTNHLDVKYQLQILKIIKSLNITVIAAIHDLNIAAMFCDQLLTIRDGHIHNRGSPKCILTREVIRDIFDVEARVVEMEKERIVIVYD